VIQLALYTYSVTAMVFRRHLETGNVTLFQLNRYQVSPVPVSLPPSYSKSENAMLFKLNSHQVSPFPISPPSCSTLIQTSLRKLMIKSMEYIVENHQVISVHAYVLLSG
jgi:hypothetical protein